MEKKDIDALVEAKVSESRTIDYKEIVGDLGVDKVKIDLLADVAAFANTAGGRIFFGVREERDAKNDPTGIPEVALGLANFNGDALIGRIESILASGIEPRVGMTPEAVDGFPLGPVLVLRVHQSWAGPHMVKDGRFGRFYSRDNTGKKPMDYHMIRDSFLSFVSLTEALRSFHRDRIAAIFRGDTPIPLEPGPRMVIHALPVSAFVPATRRSIPIRELQRYAGQVCFREVLRGRANIDGYVIPHKSEVNSTEYIQLFRTGALERVHTGFTWDKEGSSFVIGDDILKMIQSGVTGFLATQRSLGIEPPIVVMVAVKGVAGRILAYGNMTSPTFLQTSWHQGFDRDEFVLPEVICEDLTLPCDPLVEELLTIFWQAAGIEGLPKAAKRG